ncbi:hypothetical protein [Mycobacterium sp. 1245111.1]|uniref:hypothetical protein n=1 Tax=Mycobacterium sp. 1245111.1 TaxID=1834073 RepID=UPI0012EA9FD5|nr:hypothetical protein [Mycobacterium sp. 1245111.1]
MNGLGRVSHRMIGKVVSHKPSGRLGMIVKVSPPDGVYVDFNGETEFLDSEDLKE